MSLIIVAHPGKQHSFQTVCGVIRLHGDVEYCTTVYDKPGSVTRLLKPFLGKRDAQKASTRHCPQIPDDKVHQILEWYGLYQLFMLRRNRPGGQVNRINDRLNVWFGHRAAILAAKKGAAAVISYDNNSMTLFSDLQRNAPATIRILDVSAANRIYMKKIYEEDCKLSPDFADQLREECPILQSEEVCRRIQKEIDLSQYFLVGSCFVKKSLEYSGVKPDQIYVCPYGVDTGQFYRKEFRVRAAGEPIRFVFVGGTKQLKGLSYLLEAFQKIEHQKATFMVVGMDNLSGALKEKYAKDVIFTGMIPHDEICALLQNYDVMVFPSLGDGFGLAVAEAMACGLPVIASLNTGAADFIEESRNGFIVPIQNADAIAARMQWCIDHRERIPKMGACAIKTAQRLTWEEYHKKVASAVEEIIKREKGDPVGGWHRTGFGQ